MTKSIRIAIAGFGNCASFLLQSLEYYKDKQGGEIPGLMHPVMGGYRLGDIEIVSAFDVDAEKVGKDISYVANYGAPTINTHKIAEVPDKGVEIQKAPVLDGIGEYLGKKIKVDNKQKIVDVVGALKESRADILLNYLPVGSYDATRFYADTSIQTGCAFINCIPEFISSDQQWAKRFHEANLPIVGDDMKGTVGASILSRTLVKLFADRGTKIDRMYQMNFGGNTDFINLLEHSRLKYKRISKTETVQSQLPARLEDENIHIGPSDYVAWLKSRKVAHIRIEGRSFGDVPVVFDARLDVEDKSMAGGVIVDAIRSAKIALDRGIGGPLTSSSAYFMKSPPQQFPDNVARQMLDEFIRGERER